MYIITVVGILTGASSYNIIALLVHVLNVELLVVRFKNSLRLFVYYFLRFSCGLAPVRVSFRTTQTPLR